MSQDFEKLNPLKEAVHQLPQLRRVCLYLLESGHAKKTGSPAVPPSPLFCKDLYNEGAGVKSVDAGTGNSFLETGKLRPVPAAKLMTWVKRKFPWVFLTKEEAQRDTRGAWDTLIDSDTYRISFLGFCLGADVGSKGLININSLKRSAYDGLDPINVKEHWYLELSGEVGDTFFVVLQEGNKNAVQVAPLRNASIEGNSGLVAGIPANEAKIRYPSHFDFEFDAEMGLGYRRCIAVRSAVIPILPKAVDDELTLSPKELNDLALRLTTQSSEFHIDQYEFVLVDS